VVYPSYGLKLPVTDPHILLASYTWGNDAVIWGNTDKLTLKEVTLRDLSTLHNITPAFKPQDFGDNDIAVHTFLEAFALFGPNQFSSMINGMIPENGVYFAGEHLSLNHAWIFGSLNSTRRALREILYLEGIVTSPQAAWGKFPDEEFDEKSWLEYVSHI